MKNNTIITLTITLLLLFSCKTQQVSHTNKNHKKQHTHWSYTGENNPSNWSHIKEEYITCSGTSQSPINIESSQTTTPIVKNTLNVNYHESKIDIVNNGHTEEFVISKGNTIIFNGKEYELKQFHMHTVSEHTINGKHFPLEIHFVNKANDGTYAVISLLVEEGKESTFLNTYISHFPKEEGEYTERGSLKVINILPNTTHYYHYKGSFTTSPCTEAVEWILLKEHPTASKKQLERLHQLMHDNYRPLQAVNNRKIEVQ